MRTEHEMMKLILSFALNDDNIRAVYMNGSRANPKIVKDPYQDYDIVYVCREIQAYLDNHSWIDSFGKVAIIQEADQVETTLYSAPQRMDSYIFLILFQDDVRIDLCFKKIDQGLKEFGTDSATILLLDKDQCFKASEPASDKDYWVKKPSQFMVETCINEFYWCLQNVAKGLVRDQVPTALWMMNGPIQAMMTKMIEWSIGHEYEYQIACGSHGKHFKKLLSETHYAHYEKTFSDAKIDHIWASVFESITLFRNLAVQLCLDLNYPYPLEEEKNMTHHLERMRRIQVEKGML